MIKFDKIYYRNNLPNINHLHYMKRAKWIKNNVSNGRIVIVGAGFGWTIFNLLEIGINDVIGIDKSEYVYQQSNVYENMVNCSVEEFIFFLTDNIFSWNFLDCIESEIIAEKICNKMNKTKKQIHVICCDNDDYDSENYKNQNYFIKPIEYWTNLLPDAKIIDYHSGKISDKSFLKVPLSWNKISE